MCMVIYFIRVVIHVHVLLYLVAVIIFLLYAIFPLQSFVSQLVKEIYNKELRPVLVSQEKRQERKVSMPSKSANPPLLCNNKEGGVSGRETLSPLIAALESEEAFYFMYSYHRFTLFDCIVHSPTMLENSTKRPLFVLYQLLHMLSYCHSRGLTLGGDINLRNVYVDGRLWVQYYLPPVSLCSGKRGEGGGGGERGGADAVGDASTRATPTQTTPTRHVANKVSSNAPPPLPLSEAVTKWRSGQLSNFDYLMILNYYSGRRLGDPNNHPIFPWVTDFSHKNGNMRDFTLSKYRLSKGDRQLDFTYQSAQEELRRSTLFTLGSVIPHHIGDIASDVTYYVYLARRTPKEVLTNRVRPRWVPEEYPQSITKMYEWTPDECIPEFYTDPKIFYSIHSDLPDLGVPSWASSPEELVSYHRHFLESDGVSSQLHYWIDLVFGYKLVGDAAVKAKNIYLSLVDGHSAPKTSGIVQLFRSAHPKRTQTSSAPLVLFQWQHYLSMSSLLSLTAFDINPSNKAAAPSDEAKEEKTLASILDSDNVSLRHKKSISPGGGLDDGSFEHVGYPPNPDSTAVGDSVHYNGGFYDIGVLTQSPAKGVGTGRGPENPVMSGSEVTPGNKQGLLRILRPRKPIPTDAADTFEWQYSNIAVQSNTAPLLALTQVEEISHFLSKSCRSVGPTRSGQWKDEDLLVLQVRLFLLFPSSSLYSSSSSFSSSSSSSFSLSPSLNLCPNPILKHYLLILLLLCYRRARTLIPYISN